MQRQQQMQQQNMQMQQQANAQAQQVAAQAEMQKSQAKVQAETQLEQAKSQFKAQYLQQEVAAKKELMQFEFNLTSQNKNNEMEINNNKEVYKEDRKDQRINMQAAHQKEMIEQRKEGDSTKKFESSGNDILTGGANMQRFTR